MKVSPEATRRVLNALGRLPLPINHAIGSLIGTLMAWVPSKMRRAARVNIEICFPELSRREQRRLLRKTLRETGKSFTEAAIFWTRAPKELERFVVERNNDDLLIGGHAEGGGVIVAVPHLGAWELMGIYYAQRVPLNTMYRPPRNIELDPVLREVRARGGATMHPATARGVRGVRKALEQGEVAAILPDQEPAEGGVFAPFFGLPAKTMTLLPKLAQRTGAKVVFGVAERLPWGRGYRIYFEAAPEQVYAEDSEQAASAINRAVEGWARRFPSQYQWTYRRFRRQPEGQLNPYAGKPL